MSNAPTSPSVNLKRINRRIQKESIKDKYVKKKEAPSKPRTALEAARAAAAWDGRPHIALTGQIPSIEGPPKVELLRVPPDKRSWISVGNDCKLEGNLILDVARVSPSSSYDVEEFASWLRLDSFGFAVLCARQCGLDEAMVAALAKALEDHETLHVLDIRGNHIGDSGAKALSAALCKNQVLQKLYLGGNGLEGQERRSSPQIFKAKVFNTCPIIEKGVQHLATLVEKSSALRELHFGGDETNLVAEAGALALARGLSLGHSLRTLNLSMCGVGPQGANHIARALAVTGTMKLLKLNLVGNDVGDVGAFALADALHCVTCCLRVLHIAYNGISPEGVKRIAAALCENSVLRVLSLCGNQVSFEGAAALSAALVINSTLLNLKVGGTELGAKGASEIANGLQRNSALMRLSMGDNQIGDEGAEQLALALQVNVTLRDLILTDNGITECAIKKFVRTLRRNAVLCELNVELNGVFGWRIQSDLQALLAQNNFRRRVGFDPGYRTDATWLGADSDDQDEDEDDHQLEDQLGDEGTLSKARPEPSLVHESVF